jgi:hypothetical protein
MPEQHGGTDDVSRNLHEWLRTYDATIAFTLTPAVGSVASADDKHGDEVSP